MNRQGYCYNCSSHITTETKVAADHDGVPVQLCPSCGVEAGIIDAEDEAPYDPIRT